MTLSFTQPLLKNLRIDSTRSNIKLVNLDLKNTDSQFKQKVTDTMSNIQTQYWSLVSAIRDYDIKRNSLQLAQINLRDNRKKVEVGTLAPIDVTDAEATMSSREVDLISSEETLLEPGKCFARPDLQQQELRYMEQGHSPYGRTGF